MPRSTTRFATMRPSTTFGTPNREASRMTQEPTSAANASPATGMRPISGSRPTLIGVPGTDTSSSSTRVTRPMSLLGSSESFGP